MVKGLISLSRALIGVVISFIVFSCGNPAENEVTLNSFGSMLQEENDKEIGTSCNSDVDCGSRLGCFDDICCCKPGLDNCGSECVDIMTDRDHCGRCGHSCHRDESCKEGLCVSKNGVVSDEFQILGVDTPVQVTGGTPGSICYQWHVEAYPEDSVNGYPSYADLILGYGGNLNNWASSWNNWNSTIQVTPAAAPELSFLADAWATTSGGTGLEYISYILYNSSTSKKCLGIAAKTGYKIKSNQWDYPADCVGSDSYSTDGPSIHYDLGGSTLWAVDAVRTPNYYTRLQIMKNCSAGKPGGSSCPVTSTVFITTDYRNGHPTVYVNPCTHNGIVAYRTQAPEKIRLAFYTSNGTLVNNWVADSSAPYVTGSTCPGCPDPNGYHGGLSKIHLSTKYDSSAGKCYAAITWDEAHTASDSKQYLKSHLMTVDITNELSPVVKHSYISSSTSNPYHEFISTVSINKFTKGAGWFFYSQKDGPCNTKYVGWTHTNQFIGSGIWAKVTLAGPFPAVKFSGWGMTHYNGIVQRGLPGGYLFPVWAQPVQTTATNCIYCQGSYWSNPSYGTRVLPPGS